jgi:hypothetical protein
VARISRISLKIRISQYDLKSLVVVLKKRNAPAIKQGRQANDAIAGAVISL